MPISLSVTVPLPQPRTFSPLPSPPLLPQAPNGKRAFSIPLRPLSGRQTSEESAARDSEMLCVFLYSTILSRTKLGGALPLECDADFRQVF